MLHEVAHHIEHARGLEGRDAGGRSIDHGTPFTALLDGMVARHYNTWRLR